jgi:tetratricopeptide (TPR) repeat protein
MPRRVAALCIGIVVLVAAGMMLWARHVQQGGDDLYADAERASNRGQYADAARLFDRMSREFPHHPKAGDALYRLGYVYRNFLGDPKLALEAYERLVNLHGRSGSPWVKYALREIADIRKSTQDYYGALEEYEAVLAGYGKEPETVAETYLDIARTWFELGKPGSVRKTCDAILGMSAAPEPDRVEAMRLLARTSLDLESNPRDAVELYQRIINECDAASPACRDAQKELAYLRATYPDIESSAGRSAPTGPALAPPGGSPLSTKAVLVELPRSLPGGTEDAGLIQCVRILCAARGRVVNTVKLEGFSTEAFALRYSSSRRLQALYVTGTDPVVVACQRAGVSGARLIRSPSESLAMVALKAQLHNGGAVVVPLALGGHPTWRIVQGYDPTRGEFYLYTTTGRYEAVGGDDMRRAWRNVARPAVLSAEGRDPGGYVMYVVNGPSHATDTASVVKSSLSDAVALLRGGAKLGDFSSGAPAFKALAKDMQAACDGSADASEVEELTDWCNRAIPELRRRVGVASAFLQTWRESVFTGDARRHIGRAIDLLGDADTLLGDLGPALAHAREGTGPIEGGGSPQALAARLAELCDQVARALDSAL